MKNIYEKESISNEGEITELKKESKLKIATKAVYKNNSLVLSFNLIIFLVGMREMVFRSNKPSTISNLICFLNYLISNHLIAPIQSNFDWS